MCVCVCVRVCGEREREREKEREREGGRERERERTVSFPRPAYPKIHLSVLQTVCVRIFRFMNGLISLFCFAFFFFGCTTNQSRQKSLKGQFFYHLSFILRTECELTFSIKQMHYKTGTLWHSDASILLTSVDVVLDKRHSDAFILFMSTKVPSAGECKRVKSCSG